jgi:hypothetical protein
VLNPVNRALLRTPAGRRIGSLALLEFSGRRTGRRHAVTAGWHEAGGEAVIVSPAPWRANFIGGAPVTVHHRGHTMQMRGTLVTDAAQVADALNEILSSGTAPRALGLGVPAGHVLTPDDVAAVDRALIRLRPA